jgi:hypothetical protein
MRMVGSRSRRAEHKVPRRSGDLGADGVMGKKILLVEDDPIARKGMERLILNDPRLAAVEPRVVQAASGQQGLACLRLGTPGSHHHRPVHAGDGWFRLLPGAARSPLRQGRPHHRRLGDLQGRGPGQPALATKFRRCFLPKPLQPDDLMRTILTCLGRARCQRQIAVGEAKPQRHHRLRPTTSRRSIRRRNSGRPSGVRSPSIWPGWNHPRQLSQRRPPRQF